MYNKNNFLQRANRLGLFLATLFALCFIWYFIRPVEQELHLGLLKLSYFGFSGMNFGSFILGAVQSYLWGYIFLGLWQLFGCCKRSEK